MSERKTEFDYSEIKKIVFKLIRYNCIKDSPKTKYIIELYDKNGKPFDSSELLIFQAFIEIQPQVFFSSSSVMILVTIFSKLFRMF